MIAITLDLYSVVDLTDEQFRKLCQANPDIKLERTAKGELIVIPPTGGETGDRSIWLYRQSSALMVLRQ
jgi:Uma2 family endonuclease